MKPIRWLAGAVLFALLAWALIFAYRKGREERQGEVAREAPVIAPSRVAAGDGGRGGAAGFRRGGQAGPRVRGGATGVGGAGGAAQRRHRARFGAHRIPAGAGGRPARERIDGAVARAGIAGRRRRRHRAGVGCEGARRSPRRRRDAGGRAPGRDRAGGAGAPRHQRPLAAAGADCVDGGRALTAAGAARGATTRPERTVGSRTARGTVLRRRPGDAASRVQLPACQHLARPRGGAAGDGVGADGRARSAAQWRCRPPPTVQWEGLLWAYVERAPGQFSRVRIPTSTPLPQGWAVRGSIAPGDRVVTVGAEQLLSEEFRAQVQVGDEVAE